MGKKISNIYPWIVVALLWVVALLNYMDRQMLSTMREAMQVDVTELQSAANFGRLMAVFLWIYGLISPFAGAIADRISRKWLIIVSLGVWSAVTLLMGWCHSYHQLLALRALMGVSEALYIPAGLSLIADYHEGKSRSFAIGIHMTGLYLGQAAGGFGASFAEIFSWQQTFHWFGLVGLLYAVVLIFCLHEKRGAAVSAEPAAQSAGDAEAGTQAGAFREAGHHRACDGPDGAQPATQPAAQTGAQPARLPLLKSFGMIFSNIAFWAILFFFASTSLPGWATKNWLPTLFADGLGIPMSQAGPISTITIAVSSFIGVMVGGPLSDRWVRRNLKGRVWTSAIGLSLMIPSLILLGLGHGLVSAIAAGLLFGIGYGMFDTNNMPILCQFVPSRLRATAYGIMNMTGVIAGAVCTQVLGAWADKGNLGLAFAVLGIITALALIAQLTLLKPVTDDMK